MTDFASTENRDTENRDRTRLPPKVALVHDWLTGMRGGEKVLEEMARLYPEAPIFTLFHFPGSVSAELESHPIKTSFIQRLPQLQRRYRHYLPLFPRAIESLKLQEYDLVLSTSHCVAKGIKIRSDAKHLCYCHTPMRYVWDQQRTYFPKSNHPIALIRDGLLARLRRWDQRTAHRATHFLANSHFVQSRITRYYQRSSQVLAPPVDVDFFRPAHDTGSPAGTGRARKHLLCVAALNAYKKVSLAIEASSHLGLPLMIVGGGPDQERLQTQAAELGATNVTFRTNVSKEELRDLYREAIAFVQPGIEDFGIASVEALACGTPVVAAAKGGVLDIVTDGIDGILYPPDTDVRGLVVALEKVETLPSEPHAMVQRAQKFSTQAFSQQLKDAIHAVQFPRG